MASYYVQVEGEQQGPISLEALRDLQINPDQQVWTAGFEDWRPAAEVPELAGSLAAQPLMDARNLSRAAPIPRQDPQHLQPSRISPPTWSWAAEHQDLILLFVLGSYLLGDILNLMLMSVDYDSATFRVFSAGSTLFWLVFSFVPILLALLVRPGRWRTIALVLASLGALHGVFSALRYSSIIENVFGL